MAQLSCIICQKQSNDIICQACIEKLRIHYKIVNQLFFVVNANNINPLTDLLYLLGKSFHGNLMINFNGDKIQSTNLKISSLPNQSFTDILR